VSDEQPKLFEVPEVGSVSEAASALGKLGGAKGGKARARALTAEQLSESGRKAVTARWAKAGKAVATLPKVLYGEPEKPVKIGDIAIPAYVLDDGRRVLAQRGLQSGIGMSEGGGKEGAPRMTEFLAVLESKGIDTKGLAARLNLPIEFTPKHGGRSAFGFEATILPDICAVVIDAATQGKLLKSQRRLAERCAILQHGFATVGIIALVDEATGYQKYRKEAALAEILEKFISTELRKWARRFPFEYYEEFFRLKGWDRSDLTPNSPKPREVGRMTDDLIYQRLAPAVRAELRRLTPRNEKGYLKTKLHQRLTDDIGNPKLEKHISNIITTMKLSPDWTTFMANVNRLFRKYGDEPELDLDY
jgi:P63C domain-containing protein